MAFIPSLDFTTIELVYVVQILRLAKQRWKKIFLNFSEGKSGRKTKTRGMGTSAECQCPGRYANGTRDGAQTQGTRTSTSRGKSPSCKGTERTHRFLG